ncbi:hypothetical protein KAR91_52395 [Candidatus Pacearchaeota archaeon]|nr:hypothetical protein [Candidatus Pacearchaeota archaeon]
MDLEKIKYLPNGQWELAKAKTEMPGPYAIEHDNPDHKYKGKDLHQHIRHTIKTASTQPHKALKMDINPATGKNEPHIMLHRGMPDSNMPMDSKRLGNQKFEVTDSHVNHEKTGVHTAIYNVADSYSGGYGGGKGEAQVHSFWVPVTHVMNNLSFANIKNERQNEHGDHMTVGPGNYKKISEEEKKDMMSKRDPKPTAKDHIDAHSFRSKIEGLDSEPHENYSKKIRSFSDESVKELAGMHNNPRVHESLSSDKDYHNAVLNHVKTLK